MEGEDLTHDLISRSQSVLRQASPPLDDRPTARLHLKQHLDQGRPGGTTDNRNYARARGNGKGAYGALLRQLQWRDLRVLPPPRVQPTYLDTSCHQILPDSKAYTTRREK